MSAEMVEIEILVPVSAQTCGQQPAHRWDFGSVKIQSFDTPQVETIWEKRTVRVPRDASMYKFNADGKEWVCRKRADPPPDDERRRRRPGLFPQQDRWTTPEAEPEWHPIAQDPWEHLPHDAWEEAGRFHKPTRDAEWLKVGRGFPVEFYGVEAGIGVLLAETRWREAERLPLATEVRTDSQGRGFGLELELLAGFGDVTLQYGEWTIDQDVRVAGGEALARGFDITVSRDLEFRWIGVEWRHPWLAIDPWEHDELRLRIELETALGGGLLSGRAKELPLLDSEFPGVGPVAPPLREQEAIGTLSARLEVELRHRGRFSVGLGLELSMGIAGEELFELGPVVGAFLDLAYRW
jgi:hypothetical protein